MAREIKFRIFDTYDGRFCSSMSNKNHRDCYFSIHPYGGLVAANEYGEDEHIEEKRYVIQQFTGLRDSKGRDIYEGDIIKVTTKEPKPDCQYCMGDHWMDDGSDPFLTVERFAKVFWNKEGRWAVEYPNWITQSYTPEGIRPVRGGLPQEGVEIVGNIFENPEFFNQNNKQKI